MKQNNAMFFLTLVFVITFLISSPDSFAQKDGYELVWHDEFNGTQLDLTKWQHRGLGSRRGGSVVEEATTVDGKGNLIITTTILDSTHYEVGMIGTGNTYNTTYGYFEARVKFGKVLMWDSFWLQCPTAYAAGPPSETGAEIDICEFSGGASRTMKFDDNGVAVYDTIGYNVNHNVWWGDDDGVLKGWGAHSSVIDNVEDYVILGLKWTEDRYYFYVNNVFTFSTNKGVSGVDEYIILSVEPYYWNDLPENIQNGATVNDTFFVDYVRVYKKLLTDVEDEISETPSKYSLEQNYPNPFNPTTTINYQIPNNSNVVIKVFNTRGEEVAQLVNEFQTAGSYSVKFNASANRQMPSGIYFYRMESDNFSKTKKLMLLK